MSALNKHWRPLSTEEYLDKMDIIDTVNACKVAEIPQRLADEIWKVDGFEVMNGS